MDEIFRQGHAVPGEPQDQRVARLHRLYLARLLASGGDVIDLAGSDGAVLGQVARSLAASGASADLVIAYGLLARAADPADWLARIAPLVRPGGRLLLDVPGPGAALDARRVFTADSLSALLLGRFAQVRLFAQHGLIGSVLHGAGGTPAVFTHRDALHVERSRAIPQPEAWIAVASDAPLDDLGDSLLIDAGMDALAAAQAQAVQARTELRLLRQDHAALQATRDSARQSDAAWRHQLASLRVSEAAARSRAAVLEAERDEAVRTALSVITPPPAAPAIPPMILPAPQPITARLRRLWPASGARVTAIARSAVFDSSWYLAQNPDVRAAGMDPARHYLRHGAAEQRDPGPDFDGAWYAAQHADLAGSSLTAVEHYERHGRAAAWPTRPPAEPVVIRPENPKLLFVSGESDTPGSQYRCVRMAQAARAAGWSAGWSPIEHTGAIELIGVEIVVLWRVRWSRHVEGVMAEIRQQGGIVVFDIDDLMIRPELAAPRVIDGIRSTNAGIGSTRETFVQVQQAMLRADLCSTTTEELAAHMRAFQKATYVLPNSFDTATLARARLAVRRRALDPGDGLVRIGYAAGTLTHQKDFLVALPGLVAVLAARAQVRLVLFRAKAGPELVLVEEFEALSPYLDRIEWRDKVALDDLPAELARFDINLAPLERGNPFCEAKSELKYFESALVNVPTVASPTGPFRRCIVHGQTGMLAEDDAGWHDSLLRLVDDATLRTAIGARAYLAALYPFGPQRCAEAMASFLSQIRGGSGGACAFAADLHRPPPAPPIPLAPSELLYRCDRLGEAEVTVIVPCYNYAEFIIEALESVRAQTLTLLDLIVVDDRSTDPLTLDLILHWAATHEARFNRLIVLRHIDNAGLSAARNTGFAAAETPYVLPLDADNRLRPDCCTQLLAALAESSAAYAYPSVQMFGADDQIFCNEAYRPMRLVGGNYIDAMAMIAKWAWAAAGGYDMPRRMGWEDFDLWCTLAEHGHEGLHVNTVQADYRVHAGSMVSQQVEVQDAKQAMVRLIEQRHPWLRLSSRTPHDRV